MLDIVDGCKLFMVSKHCKSSLLVVIILYAEPVVGDFFRNNEKFYFAVNGLRASL